MLLVTDTFLPSTTVCLSESSESPRSTWEMRISVTSFSASGFREAKPVVFAVVEKDRPSWEASLRIVTVLNRSVIFTLPCTMTFAVSRILTSVFAKPKVSAP